MTTRMQIGRLWVLLMLGTTVAAAAQEPQRESNDRDRQEQERKQQAGRVKERQDQDRETKDRLLKDQEQLIKSQQGRDKEIRDQKSNQQQARVKEQQDQARQTRERQVRDQQDRDKLAQNQRAEQQRSSSQGQRLRQTNPFGMWQPYRARTWSTERRTWKQRGGYSGYRIPDDRFRTSFGPNNRFRMQSLPYVSIGGRPRMTFGGITFSLADPYPEYWSNNWYDQDDMYIDYWNDGYYLYNRNHPDDRVAIQVYGN